MDELKRIIIPTKDGSSTVQLEGSDITYHSTHGAVQESLHIFLKCGFLQVVQDAQQDVINIFEMGFGTGLNAFLTALETDKIEQKVHYTACELYPLSNEELQHLNYASGDEETHLFEIIHAAHWNEIAIINPHFTLQKVKADLAAFQAKDAYQVIYFDAFAPGFQPELWTTEVFTKMYEALTKGGMLVTYCSKSIVRRSMIAAGFQVSKLPGPLGKREILRAVKL